MFQEHVGPHISACMPQHRCGQRAALGSCFSSSTMWVQGWNLDAQIWRTFIYHWAVFLNLRVILSVNSWAREMVSLVKCLACECADLSLVHQEAPKAVCGAVHLKSVLGKWRQGTLWGLVATQPRRMGGTLAPVRDYILKSGEDWGDGSVTTVLW